MAAPQDIMQLKVQLRGNGPELHQGRNAWEVAGLHRRLNRFRVPVPD